MAVQTDPVFDRDIFLLRQQLLRISDKYDVGDEKGSNILYVERPAHLLRNLGAVLAALVVGFLVFTVFTSVVSETPPESTARTILVVLSIVLALIGAFAVGIPLSAKRHLTFYRDASKRERLLEVLQDKKWQPITTTYTVRDFRGQPLARLAKNWLYNVLRKRWYVYAPDGHLALVAKEDSLFLSVLRRIPLPFFALLLTNFVILRPEGENMVGEFKRKFTILDRYVLDMSPDRERTVDRRVALALGVMLDTGERR